jgi:hypothetical protein
MTHGYWGHSIIDDYVAIFLGSTLLRTGKLLFVVLIIVHVFTCVYWLIKTTYATDSSEIENFLSARQLDETVQLFPFPPLPYTTCLCAHICTSCNYGVGCLLDIS